MARNERRILPTYGPKTPVIQQPVFPADICVSSARNVHIDNGLIKNEVVMWPSNQRSSVVVMNVTGRCHSLFVDIYNSLYCCLRDVHQITKKSLNVSASISPTVIVGTSSPGSTPELLSHPFGIFVDVNLEPYVADTGSNRIQLLRFGKSNGSTVVGIDSPNNFTLNGPTIVVLDGDGYLFIVERDMHRIVGSCAYGYRCLAGCFNTNGSTANDLSKPISLALDSYGNLFVLDVDNNRIQTFNHVSNFCSECSTEDVAEIGFSAFEWIEQCLLFSASLYS